MLMEEYRKDLNRNYLVFSESEEQELEPDGLQMLLQNKIKGVLRLERRSVDNKSQYYYDVTGLMKLSEFCKEQKFCKKELESLLLGIADILERGVVYFLEMDGFLLKPEYIYVKTGVLRNMGNARNRLKESDICLCYYPGKGEDAAEQLNHFLEYLLNQVDYTDEKAVAQIYELYQRSCDEGFYPVRLQELLKSEREFPTREEWKEEKQRQSTGGENSEFCMEKGETERGHKERNHKESVKGNIKGNIKGNVLEESMWKENKGESLPEKSYGREKILLAAGMLGIFALYGGLYWKGFFHSTFTGQIQWGKLIGSICVLLFVEILFGYRVYLLVGKKKKKCKNMGFAKARQEMPVYGYAGKMEEAGDAYGKMYRENGMPVNCQELQPGRKRIGKAYKEFGEKEENVSLYLKPETIEKDQEPEEEKTMLLTGMEKTVLLCGDLKEQGENFYLAPVGVGDAERIPVTEFPFFCGKIPMKGRKTFENRAISRFHAKIEKEGDSFFLTDLNSTNGTFLNHVRLEANQPVLLKPGDEIIFADEVYQFTLAQ